MKKLANISFGIRIGLLIFGIVTALISRFVFLNNGRFSDFTFVLNEIISVSLLVPVAFVCYLIKLAIDLHSKDKHDIIVDIITIAVLIITVLLYIVIWVSMSGGV